MKKSTADHMHRKCRKNNLVWLFALLGILVLFLGTILAFLIFSELSSKPAETVREVSAVNVEKDIPETDMGDLIYHEPAAENVVMQGGFGYVNNELLVTLDSSDSLYALKEYLAGIGGEVVGEIPLTADYQIMLSGTYSEEELEALTEQVKSLPYVERSSLNYAFELEEDSYQYYSNDPKWDDWESTGGNNWNMKAIDAPGAWAYRNQMGPVNVGVIDRCFDAGCAYICEWDDPTDKISQGDSFTDQQLRIIAKDLGVPDDLNVEIKQYPKTYWKAAGLWDIYVEVLLDGKVIASGSFDVETGEMGRNIYIYSPI